MTSKEELITSIMTMADSISFGWNPRVCWAWMRIIRTIIYNTKPEFIYYNSNFYFYILRNRTYGKNVYNVIKPYIGLSEKAETELLKLYEDNK